MTEGRLLTVKEAANVLGVSVHTVYGWTSRRKIPYRKAGSLLRFDRQELELWTRRQGSQAKKVT